MITKIKQFFSNCCKNYFPKIKHHFDLVNNGKEELDIVLWVWGGAAYIISFFISKLVLFINIIFLKWIISILVILYFVWHIVTIRRCSPKKIPLSIEEKERLKKDRLNRFFRKLLLKESITKWNPGTVATVIDVYVIVCFAEFLF